jgi:hypothetical protein
MKLPNLGLLASPNDELNNPIFFTIASDICREINRWILNFYAINLVNYTDFLILNYSCLPRLNLKYHDI